jgi:hypothetical protein
VNFPRVSAPGLKWGGWLSNHSSKWRALVSEVKSLAKIEEVLVEGLVEGRRDRCGGPIYMVFSAIASWKFLRIGALGDPGRLRIGGRL